jgi:nephrocystin-3
VIVPSSRTARIFLSSTFRDFGEERDLLVRRVFPALRTKLKDRFVELVDVDLRWGITAERAERGEVLPICLSEIDRSRPFFVGLLGERYGWVPEKGKYPPELVEQRPWLKKHQGGKSVTELEILHGVLNNPRMAGRALFYFRSAAYAKKKGGDYLPQSPDDRSRQQDLKARIRQSGFPVVQGYKDPEALAKRLERDLWKILDEMYPADDVPDAFTREGVRHEAYAVPRRRLYLGGEGYIAALDDALAQGKQRILVEGASGGGKSALIANWLENRAKKHRKELVHVHYLGATAEASDPQALVRRLVEAIKRLTESTEEIPSDPQALYHSLSTWLAIAHAHAGKRKTKVLIVLDALNGLRDLPDLRWFPEFLPERVRMVVSCLPGQVHEALLTKGDWHRVEVSPLNRDKARELFVAYLRRYNKELPDNLLALALSHPLSTNPLFLRTLAEELRLFGVHEQLRERLDYYLTSQTVDDLFERVLERVEQGCGTKQVRKAMEGIWASRAGLSEQEIQGFANLKPAEWAPIRHALDDSLLESGGRITFAHDYMRLAVSDRYLAGNNTLPDEGQSPEALKLRRKAHIELAKWFDTRLEEEQKRGKGTKGKASKSRKTSAPTSRPADARSAEEVPWQYQQARDWRSLKAYLTRRDMFEAVYAYRSEEELLGCWLDIEAHTRARIEEEYEKAWTGWKLRRAEEITGDFASALSSVLSDAGRYLSPFAYELARLSLRIETTVYGPDSPQVSGRLGGLAKILQDKGDYGAAEPLYRRALAIAEKALGAEHPETGTCMNNLARLLHDKGDYESAEPLYRRALASAEKTIGEEHFDTGTSLNNLALLLEDKGDYEGAELLYRRALHIAKKAQGSEHPGTGIILDNLACLLRAKGDYLTAETLSRRALAIAEKVQGAEHPVTGLRLSNLAGLLQDKGDYAGAELLFRRALAIGQKAQGAEHPGTGVSLNNLASLLEAKGDYEAAEPLYRRALEIAETAQGPEHPDTGMRLNNLAGLLHHKRDYQAAESFYRRALSIAEKAQGAEHPHTGVRLNNLAFLLEDKGDYEVAESLYRRALAIAEKAQGSEHPDTGMRLNNLACLLRAKGDYEGAEPLYRRALRIAEMAQGPEHSDTGMYISNLALLLQSKGDYKAAETFVRRALAIAENNFGSEHEKFLASLSNLGDVLRRAGRYGDAEKELARAVELAEKLDFAGPFFLLAELRIDQKRYEEAVELLKRCLEIRRRKLNPSEAIGEAVQKLSEVYRLMGREADAEEILKQLPASVSDEGTD